MFKHKKISKQTAPDLSHNLQKSGQFGKKTKAQGIGKRTDENGGVGKASKRKRSLESGDGGRENEVVLVEEEQWEETKACSGGQIPNHNAQGQGLAAKDVFKDLLNQMSKINDIIEDDMHVGQAQRSPLKQKSSGLNWGGNGGKENSNCKDLLNQPSESNTPKKSFRYLPDCNSQEAMLQLMMNMLLELKDQNSLILERQSDLEYHILQDLNPKVQEGFSKVRLELKRLQSSSNKSPSAIAQACNRTLKKRAAALTTRPRVQFSKEVRVAQELRYRQSEKPQVSKMVSEGSRSQPEPLETNLIKFEEGMLSDGTFMRKLDQTVQPGQEATATCHQESLQMSIGANLLQIMQLHPPSKMGAPKLGKAKRGLRNFNFRCNLEEIDKIIEEDSVPVIHETKSALEEQSSCKSNSAEKIPKEDQEGVPELLQPKLPNLEEVVISEQIITEINISIAQEVQKDQSESPHFKRPSTGRKQPRKMWEMAQPTLLQREKCESIPPLIIPDEAEQHSSKEETKLIPEFKRPSTGQVPHHKPFAIAAGLRIKRTPITKVDCEDPILALLKQETQSSEEQKLEPTNPSELKNLSPLNFNESRTTDVNDVITKARSSGDMKVSEENSAAITPRKAKNIQIKRKAGAAMFKAPPTNLIDQLLINDSQDPTEMACTTELTLDSVDKAGIIEDVPKLEVAQRPQSSAIINNYLRDRSPTGGQKSPLHIRKVSPLGRRQIKAHNLVSCISIDQSDDEFSSAQKNSNSGENPFDLSCVKSAVTSTHGEVVEEVQSKPGNGEQMRNLFFHQRHEGGRGVGGGGDTAEFGN